MILRYDPYKIFIGSKTPAGLYARQKWLHEAGELSWQKDYVEYFFSDSRIKKQRAPLSGVV